MNENYLAPNIISLLEKVCNDKVNNVEVVIQDDNNGRQGYFGEIIYLILRHKLNNEKFHLVVKKAVSATNPSTVKIVQSMFHNEIHFYANIWRAFENFQKSFPRIKPIEIITKFYGSTSENGDEKLILENLKFSGFVMFPRDQAYDVNHMKFLLESYGRFHGISAAFREYFPEKFRLLTDKLKNSTELVLKSSFFKSYFFPFMKDTYLMIENEKIREKLKIYTEKAPEIAIDSIKYDGKNPVINHGDCWSNNMMFKYDSNGNLTDVKLLDFQLCRKGSVVTDLCYLFYCGAPKEIFEKFDYYLSIYYNEFSNTLRNFSLEPANIFTYEDLKMEWKDHWKFGFIMSQMLWRNKLCKFFEEESFVKVDEELSSENQKEICLGKYQIDNIRMNKISQYLIEHLCEYCYL